MVDKSSKDLPDPMVAAVAAYDATGKRCFQESL
jgi:hypothetical protein